MKRISNGKVISNEISVNGRKGVSLALIEKGSEYITFISLYTGKGLYCQLLSLPNGNRLIHNPGNCQLGICI